MCLAKGNQRQVNSLPVTWSSVVLFRELKIYFIKNSGEGKLAFPIQTPWRARVMIKAARRGSVFSSAPSLPIISAFFSRVLTSTH